MGSRTLLSASKISLKCRRISPLLTLALSLSIGHTQRTHMLYKLSHA